MSEKKQTAKENAEKAEREYPGMAVDYGDTGRVDPERVKERTMTLGNNPRNNK